MNDRYNVSYNSILTRGWGSLFIMHKNRHVASIRENGSVTIYYPSFMPFGLYFEDSEETDDRINNLNNFYYWCASRALTLDRKYAKEIMNSIGASQAATDKDRAAIAIAYHGISLMDVFWIRAPYEKLRFEDVNIYNHPLTDAFASVSLRGRAITAENAKLLGEKDTAGDVFTPGTAPKAWVKRDGRFCLLKDGDTRDVEAELLASKIADCFDVRHVSYVEDRFEGQRVSRCELITSPEMSIVSADALNIYCVNHDMKLIDYVLKRDAYSYYMMNIIDYLVGNTDRHWGNWGFELDNDTNKPVRMYPLMDFNKAFTAYDSIEGSVCQTTVQRMSQMDAAIEAVRKVGLNQIKKVDDRWFKDPAQKAMFAKRLAKIKNSQH